MALDGLIFFPDPQVPAPPPGVEERGFTAPDGVRLHAWWTPPAPGAPVLVWSHGNAGNIGGRVEVLCALARRGLGVLAYDYRGYGRSEGHPTEAGVYRDAEAAYDAARGFAFPATRIISFGESLGGAVSVHLATVRPCAAVILVATFTRLRDVARAHYGPPGLLAGNRLDTLARIGTLRVPVLIAHGDADEVVPFPLGERLFSAVPGSKHFLCVPGARHNDVLGSPTLLEAIATFVRDAVGGSRCRESRRDTRGHAPLGGHGGARDRVSQGH
jgi:fermentation-respiration switch protein FrsA (DUF1100 family)